MSFSRTWLVRSGFLNITRYLVRPFDLWLAFPHALLSEKVTGPRLSGTLDFHDLAPKGVLRVYCRGTSFVFRIFCLSNFRAAIFFVFAFVLGTTWVFILQRPYFLRLWFCDTVVWQLVFCTCYCFVRSSFFVITAVFFVRSCFSVILLI